VKFKQETEFRETEIGKIPRDWKVVKLGEVVEIWDKYRIPVKENERKPGSFPYCGANGIIDYIDGYTHDGEFVLLAEDGGFFGRFEKSAYIMRGKFWANNHVHVLKAIKGTIISEFLMHYLNFTDLTPFITGSTRPKLNQEAMKKIPIALPSLVEQMKIADILSTVDRTIEVVDAGVARLEGLKKALMRELLTGRIRVREENGKTVFYREIEFRETEIGKIPRDWKVVKLGEVVEIWDKYRIPVKENERKPGSFPYCGANGIIDYIDGYTHDGEFVLLAEDGGFFGRFEKSAYIMRGKFWANNHVHVLKAIKGTIISEFLMHYLNFTDLTPFITGSTRPKLNQEAMKKIPIALPSLVEQMKIADILSTVDRTIELYYEERTRLDRLKRGLMDLLLTGRVRVVEE